MDSSEQQEQIGMFARLQGKTGIAIIADQDAFRLLDSYCVERLHGQFKVLSAGQYGNIVVTRRRCEVD